MASTSITVSVLRSGRNTIQHFFGTRQGPLLSHSLHGPRLQGVALPEHASIVSVKQVHGTDILILEGQGQSARVEAGREAGWDALVTNQPEVVLTVRTADCVPVLLHDPVQGVVAAVHAGWRGTMAGIVALTVTRMVQRFGSKPRNTRVGIGPSIGPCCYEVDAVVLDALRRTGVDYRRVVNDTVDGKGMLDLGALIRFQAETAGVPSGSIDRVELCTGCHPDMFYSYRRDRAVVGTMVSGVMLLRPASVTQRRGAGP
jgi:polyphenol oxidase